jgi:choline-phosphate cytidylyltransferase
VRTVITYGTYDLLHRGHIRLLERAKALGDYLIVGVTSDTYDQERGKLNVVQSTLERVDAVRATGIPDKVIVEEYEGQKIDDIRKYGADVFTVGSDWRGFFDYLGKYCEVVYLERTRGVSSTELRAKAHPPIRGGIIGMDYISERFYDEHMFVSGIDMECVLPVEGGRRQGWAKDCPIDVCASEDELMGAVDAVFVFEPADRHFSTIMNALGHGCHVFCDAPAFLSRAEAEEALSLAGERGLLVFDGLKTLHFPAFEHLLVMATDVHVGEIVDIDAACSQIPRGWDPREARPVDGAFYDWGPTALMPAVKLAGTAHGDVSFSVRREGAGADAFTRMEASFGDVGVSVKVGKGVKTEGDLVITGTKGYIYVPAPWWLCDYFEVRHEDPRDTRKVFFQYKGEGMRYEILDFVRAVNAGLEEDPAYGRDEILCEAGLMEAFGKLG